MHNSKSLLTKSQDGRSGRTTSGEKIPAGCDYLNGLGMGCKRRQTTSVGSHLKMCGGKVYTVIDESDPESYRRYKRWQASRAYHERNREARNAKKRERMAALRAQQKFDPPIVRAA
ncbi:hypothetical protein B0H14DRAFT_2588090 [Mycena olivaceomarginata]|nr:hypothetical protein B0H14DRAFT_2588090 [Mycena olivaceomarginata]